MFETFSTLWLLVAGVVLALLCVVAYWAKMKYARRRGRVIYLVEPVPTHRKLSTQENIGGQISNRLKKIAKSCIVRSGSRLVVRPLGIQQDTGEFLILIGWEVWIDGKSHSTIDLMYINVSPRSIKIDSIKSEYSLIEFPNPYLTSTAPGHVSMVIADVGKYLSKYYAAMMKNNRA